MKLQNKFIYALIYCVFLIACGRQENNDTGLKETDAINTKQETEIHIMIRKLSNALTLYMKEANPPYTAVEINRLETILTNYLRDLEHTQSKAAGMKIVQETVDKLNRLNDECQGSLIETSEREQIAEIIILAGYKKGYNSKEEDITEQWREW